MTFDPRTLTGVLLAFTRSLLAATTPEEVLTGVNLPMVVRLTCPGLEGLGVAELGKWLQAKGQRSVCLASDVAQQRCGPGAKVGCS